MSKKIHYLSLAGCLIACAATALPQDAPFASRPNYDAARIASTSAESERQTYSLTRITLAMDINEETCKDLVTAHEHVLRKLREALNEHDPPGTPTARAHLAAKTLIALNDREVIPFLVRNLDYNIPLPFSFTLEPVLEGCPYISPLIQQEERGAQAILDVVVRDREDTITDREWMFYGYVLVHVFGSDEKSRHAALAFIDQRDPQRTNEELNRLRESVRTVKRYFGR